MLRRIAGGVYVNWRRRPLGRGSPGSRCTCSFRGTQHSSSTTKTQTKETPAKAAQQKNKQPQSGQPGRVRQFLHIQPAPEAQQRACLSLQALSYRQPHRAPQPGTESLCRACLLYPDAATLPPCQYQPISPAPATSLARSDISPPSQTATSSAKDRCTSCARTSAQSDQREAGQIHSCTKRQAQLTTDNRQLTT